jgi:hypothetical protein
VKSDFGDGSSLKYVVPLHNPKKVVSFSSATKRSILTSLFDDKIVRESIGEKNANDL